MNQTEEPTLDSANKPTAEQEAEILTHWETSWKEADKEVNFPHVRKEFTFNKKELRTLTQQATIETLGQKVMEFSRMATNDLINMEVLPRVGIIPNPEMRILYDFASKRFMVWMPKEAKPTVSSLEEPEQPQ